MNAYYARFTGITEKKLHVWPLYILFLTSVDTVLFGTNSNTLFIYVPRIVGLLFLGALPFIVHNMKIRIGKQELILLLLCSILVISCIINGASFGTMASRLISVMTGYAIARYYRHHIFVYAFTKFMYFISWIAIITEIFAYIAPGVIRILPAVINTANRVFYVFGISGIQADNLDNTLIRSSSIFWEPGAFSIYLVLAIIYELFQKDNQYNVARLTVFIFCLIITFSTTGYIVFAVIMIVFAVTQKNVKSKKVKFAIVFAMILLISATLLTEDNIVLDKVFGKIYSRESTMVTRVASIVNGFEIAMDYPVFGISPENMRSYMAIYASKSTLLLGQNPMNTNTVFYQFAAFGIIFGLIFLFGQIKYMLRINRTKLCGIGLAVALLLLYSGEALYSFLPFTFLFYGWLLKKEEGSV